MLYLEDWNRNRNQVLSLLTSHGCCCCCCWMVSPLVLSKPIGDFSEGCHFLECFFCCFAPAHARLELSDLVLSCRGSENSERPQHSQRYKQTKTKSSLFHSTCLPLFILYITKSRDKFDYNGRLFEGLWLPRVWYLRIRVSVFVRVTICNGRWKGGNPRSAGLRENIRESCTKFGSAAPEDEKTSRWR